jgi:hypothetical protein
MSMFVVLLTGPCWRPVRVLYYVVFIRPTTLYELVTGQEKSNQTLMKNLRYEARTWHGIFKHPLGPSSDFMFDLKE